MQVSTGLRDYLMQTGSLKSAMNGAKLYIYAGTVPDSPDDALTDQTLLCTITVSGGGTGVTLGTPTSDANSTTIPKASGEAWQGTISNAGGLTATFFRMTGTGVVADSPPSASSTTALRLQGTVSEGAGDLILSETTLVDAATQDIDFFNISLPIGS